jgi:hypothetical protein
MNWFLGYKLFDRIPICFLEGLPIDVREFTFDQPEESISPVYAVSIQRPTKIEDQSLDFRQRLFL